jgi:hypothetical protein
MSTQLFISWSGDLSHKVATHLHEWIPTVLQSAEPFLSSTDIEKGSRWSDHVAKKLEECGFGIIVLTPGNLYAPWILFEAGALSKMVGRGQVSSLLIGLDLVDVKQPLSQFQNTKFERNDVYKLIGSINRAGPNPLKEEVLQRAFSALWPEFERTVNAAISEHPKAAEQEPDTDAEKDLDSLKGAVGDLIQSVQSLRDDVRRTPGDASLPEALGMIRMEIRRQARLHPRLFEDLEFVRTTLDDGHDILEDNNAFENSTVADMVARLDKAIGYLRRRSAPREYGDDSSEKPSLF